MLCKQCHDDKSASDFYERFTVCKECHKSNVRTRARTNPKVQEYDRTRAKLPHRIEQARSITKRWRAKNPVAYQAHTAVSNAVRDGRLTKLPCEFCGSEKVHAHHKDYTKPLDVIWLCAKCHHRLHAMFPELEGTGKAAANG